MSLISTVPPQSPQPSRSQPRSIPVPFLRNAVPAGDAVAAMTTAAGIQPCGGCKQRQAAWNQYLVFSPWRNR